MAKCNQLTYLPFKGLSRWLLGAGFPTTWVIC